MERRTGPPCPAVSAPRSRDELVKLIGVPVSVQREGIAYDEGSWKKPAKRETLAGSVFSVRSAYEGIFPK